ncbi:MAG: ribosome maturation factor RimM [Fidelibacterota bacterium]
MEKLFAIARVTHSSGLNGEVRIRPLVRFFDAYINDRALYLGATKTVARETKLIKTVGRGKNRRFLFEGITDRDQAEILIGQTLYASVQASDPIHLLSPELIGASVYTNAGEFVGELVDMLALPANDVYVIENGKREVLIPVIDEIVRGADLDHGIVTISPMDGLLD